MDIAFTVNGAARSVAAPETATLLDILRNQLGLMGTRYGCGLEQCGCCMVLVELPDAGNVRMLGNLLGDPRQEVRIGADVEAVFEPHDDAKPPFTLVQWKLA